MMDSIPCPHGVPDGIGGNHCGPGGRHAGRNVSAGVCRACLGLPAARPAPRHPAHPALPPPDPALVEVVAHPARWRCIEDAVNDRGSTEARILLENYHARYGQHDLNDLRQGPGPCKCRARLYARLAVYEEWRKGLAGQSRQAAEG